MRCVGVQRNSPSCVTIFTSACGPCTTCSTTGRKPRDVSTSSPFLTSRMGTNPPFVCTSAPPGKQRRTLPATTQRPMRFMMSVMSVSVSGAPARFSSSVRTQSSISFSAAGPEATPPKPLIGVPNGRISE